MEKSMKKLLTALATAATAALGFAEIKGTEGFEDSSYTAYDNNKPVQDAAYPFDGYGNYYRSLDDDGDEELLADGASCVDAVMQFKYADAPDEFDGTEKLVVFANSAGKLVVVDADATNVTTTAIAEDTWYRLTIVSVDETVNNATVKKFKVYVNGTVDGAPVAPVATEGGTDSFKSRVADSNSVTKMTLSGTGKVDNFVARTTNPFGGAPTGWVAKVGDDPEQHFTDYTKALKAALLAGAKLTFADGVTEMDGTAAHPFEIRTAADLVALQAAVAAGNGADKCYVQTADIALTEAWPGIGVQNGKDIVSTAAFDNGAFTGTYDGDNHTISNFQMQGGGLDYCGFFNSTYGATIKNLKIQYAGALFAADTTASTKESGATFVGVAKNSTLQNLTSLEGTVSCSKGFGGIVGYTTSGTTVDSCTNNVNMTSLANNKCGGIAMITQTGAAVTIRNCQNNGTQTTGSSNSEYGAIVGYVGLNTTIADCETTVGRFLKHNNNTVTLQGVNKGDARVASYHGAATPGLNFATVDGNVATFVADDALAAGNTYKVMGPGAAYAFAQAGAISFDKALATVTVTAAEGLVLTTSTSGTVTTYTAAAAVAKIGDTKYTSLAAALAAAESGDTVTLAANIAVTEMQLVNKTLTLDLAGFAITAGERSAEAATAGDDSILCVLHGGSLTINDSSAGGTGAITGNSVFTTGVKMTKKGDTDDTNKATLVVNGGTITGYYYGIAGNGLAGRGNTEVTINGGTIKGTCDNDCVAIFQPQLGTLTINGGYLEGAMGVYVKSGTATVAINGGTIKGNGTYAAYEYKGNGFKNTGDAFVVDNAGYPGGAPAPSILGGTFVSVNASAIASYAKTGLERIVHFADKDAVTITEAKASAEDVFLVKGFPGGADGKTFSIDTAVQAALAEKIPAGKTLADPVEGTTSGVTYAQAYALGLLDEETGNVEKDVTPTIEVKNGKVVVSLDATAKAGYKVMLTIYESTSLKANAAWTVKATYALDSETEAAGFTPSTIGAGFYKVGVTIEDAPSGN